MNTHKEEVDVPDGWTIEMVQGTSWAGQMTEGVIQYHLKRLPPPELPLKNCPFCGGKIIVEGGKECGAWWFAHESTPDWCWANFAYRKYPTRAAAIEAANRRAG
jgi:hypothetical protein